MIKIFAIAAARKILNGINENLVKYINGVCFAEEYVSDAANKGIIEREEYDISFPALRSNLHPHESEWERDFENSKALYDALVINGNVPFSVLSDQRFVIYMTHVVYWDHLVRRWPISDEKDKTQQINRIQTRYLFGKEPLSRNEFLRLIVVPHLTYDRDAPDPYHLTYIAKQYSDCVDRLLERALSKDKRLLKCVLLAIETEPSFSKINSNNTSSRAFGVWLNNLLGIRYLEALSDEEIIGIVRDHIHFVLGEAD